MRVHLLLGALVCGCGSQAVIEDAGQDAPFDASGDVSKAGDVVDEISAEASPDAGLSGPCVNIGDVRCVDGINYACQPTDAGQAWQPGGPC